jgi:hypothetical protein
MRHRRWSAEWSRDTYATSLLASGFSLGEGVAVVALIGVLIALALMPVRHSMDHFTSTEVLWMSAPQKLDWAEQWAVHGDMPVSRSRAAPKGKTLRQVTGLSIDRPDDLSRYLSSIDRRTTDGMTVFTLKARAPRSTIALRAAFGPGEYPATVLWLCGRAPVPRGFVRVGEDRTVLADEALPSPCRGTS